MDIVYFCPYFAFVVANTLSMTAIDPTDHQNNMDSSVDMHAELQPSGSIVYSAKGAWPESGSTSQCQGTIRCRLKK